MNITSKFCSIELHYFKYFKGLLTLSVISTALLMLLKLIWIPVPYNNQSCGHCKFLREEKTSIFTFV